MRIILALGLISLLTACGQTSTTDMKEADSTEKKMTREEYLDKNVFYGLTNLNNGFDAEGIKYFSESDFEIVLSRVRELGLGVNGIEPWKNGEYYGVEVYEDNATDPTDSNWYIESFNRFRKTKDTLQYSATYFIPDKLLKE